MFNLTAESAKYAEKGRMQATGGRKQKARGSRWEARSGRQGLAVERQKLCRGSSVGWPDTLFCGGGDGGGGGIGQNAKSGGALRDCCTWWRPYKEAWRDITMRLVGGGAIGVQVGPSRPIAQGVSGGVTFHVAAAPSWPSHTSIAQPRLNFR